MDNKLLGNVASLKSVWSKSNKILHFKVTNDCSNHKLEKFHYLDSSKDNEVVQKSFVLQNKT